jgi:hypothetical protein
MKRPYLILGTLVLVLLLRWAQQYERPASSPPADRPAPSIYLPHDYMNAASSLAADDFAKARTSLTALSKASTGDLQSKAHAAAAAADITAMREAFKSLTEEVAVNMSYPDEYAVAFCPMYKGGSKWIQKRESPIANPYFGKSMPTCGAFVD